MGGAFIAYDPLVSATDIKVLIMNSLILNNTQLETADRGFFSGGLTLAKPEFVLIYYQHKF